MSSYSDPGYWVQGYAVDDAPFVPAVPPLALSVDLDGYTISSLATFLEANGVTVEYLNSAFENYSAMVLVDGAGNQDQSNGDHLYGFTTLLWSYLSAVAFDLRHAQTEICEALKQMSVMTAEAWWLEFLGGYYKVPRLDGEQDDPYAFRIIAETLMPKGNNLAMSAAIERVTQQRTDIVDVSELFVVSPNYYDGSHVHDGSITYFSVGGSVVLTCLFDAFVAYDLLGDVDIASYRSKVVAQINRLRDAGTFLRHIMLSGASALTDADPSDVPGDLISFVVGLVILYNGTYLHDGTVGYGGLTLAPEVF